MQSSHDTIMAKWEDAYRADDDSLESDPAAGRASSDPAIENEPHLRGSDFASDPSEHMAGRELDPLGASPTKEDQLESSVWDEPALAARFGDEDLTIGLTYDRWLANGEQSTSNRKSWLLSLLIACAAGPAAVIGTFLSQSSGWAPAAIMMCVVGPLVEEIMKASIILWIVEKRPYLFKSTMQIMLCGIASGLMFAAIENVLYLNVYFPNASPSLATWRWTVCVLLHVGCTCISAYGLSRVWKKTTVDRTRPQISLASTFVIVAVLTHAIYNTCATIFS